MAKFRGIIGFVIDDVETSPGIFETRTVKRTYTGDIYKDSKRMTDSSSTTNQSVSLSMTFSFLADNFAMDYLYAMSYLIFRGKKWQISTLELKYPRMEITLGGLYNENQNFN